MKKIKNKYGQESCCGCSCGRCRHQGGRDNHTSECEELFWAIEDGDFGYGDAMLADKKAGRKLKWGKQ